MKNLRQSFGLPPFRWLTVWMCVLVISVFVAPFVFGQPEDRRGGSRGGSGSRIGSSILRPQPSDSGSVRPTLPGTQPPTNAGGSPTGIRPSPSINPPTNGGGSPTGIRPPTNGGGSPTGIRPSPSINPPTNVGGSPTGTRPSPSINPPTGIRPPTNGGGSPTGIRPSPSINPPTTGGGSSDISRPSPGTRPTSPGIRPSPSINPPTGIRPPTNASGSPLVPQPIRPVRPVPPPPRLPAQSVFALQLNFGGYGVYWTPDWYHRHHHAWHPPVVVEPYVWWRSPSWVEVCTWNHYHNSHITASVAVAPVHPVPYNYGDNVVYRDGLVYVNGVPYVAADRYYDLARELALRGNPPPPNNNININVNSGNTGNPAGGGAGLLGAAAREDDKVPVAAVPEVPKMNDEWIPLGTFAVVSSATQKSSDTILQLAMNKDGIIRGNEVDESTGQVMEIIGAADQETQRVAFHLKDNDKFIAECGLWNLTQETVPLLLHFGDEHTETRTLVRLAEPPAK